MQSEKQSQSKQKDSQQQSNQKPSKGGIQIPLIGKFDAKPLFWFLVILLFLPFFFNLIGMDQEEIPVSQLIKDIREEKIEEIVVQEQQLEAKYTDGSIRVSKKEPSQSLTEILAQAEIRPDETSIRITTPDAFMRLLAFFGAYILPVLILGGIILFIMRRQMGGNDGLFAMGKSKAKMFLKGKQSIRFKDVGGLKEAKLELEEIVDFLKHPKKYKDVGARVPKGVLLVGPSGTGKTMLAKAVAGEANVTFLSIAGSEFMEMLVGVGASRARDLFATAKKVAPAIIFIDEIDAIGRMRGQGAMSGGHDEREQTLNQILVEMDGFTPNDAVIVLAATNRGDMLDPALVRPGRFDRRVTLDLPDLEERKFILSIHAKNKPFTKEVNWDRIAKRTVGFSGADLENMLNEAAILIARNNKKEISGPEIEEAALKVKLGPEKKRLQSDIERSMTAYHEAGHAVLAHVLPHVDPVHRISIVSRGRALGFTMTPPEHDKYQKTKNEYFEEIIVLLGGRTAEQLIFNELTGGASNDIQRVTAIARAMVIDFGMSPLGPIHFGPQYDMSDYGRAMYEPAQISDDLQAKVDTEIRRIVETAQKEAERLLKKYRKNLVTVAEGLLVSESLDQDEFLKLMAMPKSIVKS